MKSSEYLKSIGVELSDEQVEQVNENMKVKGQSRVEKKYAIADKEKIGNIKTNQKKLLAMALVKSDEPVDQESWANLAIEEGLQTKQDPTRIVAYYKKALVDEGVIKEVTQ